MDQAPARLDDAKLGVTSIAGMSTSSDAATLEPDDGTRLASFGRKVGEPIGYSFEGFDVQLRAGCLSKDGERVKIQELPFRLLCILLERRGEVLGPDELGPRLWGKDTFVDFSSGLRVAARKLREALGDQASAPRFVKSISGRGYQFIGEVVPLYSSAPETVLTEAPIAAALRRLLRPKALLGIGLGVLIIVAASIAIYVREHDALIDSDASVILSGVQNRTLDAGLEGLLTRPFRVKFEESPYLNIMAERAFLTKITKPDTADIAEQLRTCAQLHGKILLRGEIVDEAPGYEFVMQAWNCEKMRLLDTERAHANAQATLLDALDEAQIKMRRRLGESTESLLRHNVPASQATTDSLGALRAFNAAEEKRRAGMAAESLADYKIAIDLDPHFAMAYASEGAAYFVLHQQELARESLEKAFALREHTSDRERLYIASHYYDFALGDTPHEIEALEIWHTTYPHDFDAIQNLSYAYTLIGRREDSLVLSKEAVRLQPAESTYNSLLASYLWSNHLPEANRVCADPETAKIESEYFRSACLYLDAQNNDWAGVDREIARAKGKSTWPITLDREAVLALSRGQFSAACAYFEEAARVAHAAGDAELESLIYLDEAAADALYGLNARAGEASLRSLLLAPKVFEIRGANLLVKAQTDHTNGLNADIAKLRKDAPENMLVEEIILPSAEAAQALHRHDAGTAITALEHSRPYDHFLYLDTSTAYFRGLAYMDRKQWDDAKREFSEVLTDYPVRSMSFLVTPAMLKLGRTYQLAGDAADAQKTYAELHQIWKDADHDFPPLVQLNQYERELNTRR
jgi:eukaryotic-like serine/threonine-protein kinase